MLHSVQHDKYFLFLHCRGLSARGDYGLSFQLNTKAESFNHATHEIRYANLAGADPFTSRHCCNDVMVIFLFRDGMVTPVSTLLALFL
ncbi:hypothetical protein FHW89_005051 [Mucilaginibacter sp. SG564]|nr:hypothetical protein [Mucilaginibacter sp. SG564]